MKKYTNGKPLRSDLMAVGCDGKQKFGSFTQARKFGASRKGFNGGAYHCRACNGFHVGQKWERRIGRRPRVQQEEEEMA